MADAESLEETLEEALAAPEGEKVEDEEEVGVRNLHSHEGIHSHELSE